ncbi:Syntaxin-12, partial [Caligus rogercresseyi]
KDTSQQWKELNTLWTAQGGDQRQWKIQRDRLQNDFTRALNTFQAAQRSCAQKEKESIRRAKSQNNKGKDGIILKWLKDTLNNPKL